MKYGFFILFLMIFSFKYSEGAPYPATSSSILITKHQQIISSSSGYIINAKNTKWISRWNDEKHIFSDPSNLKANLILNEESIEGTSNLETNAKKWIKEYPQYGFEILGSKPYTQDGQKAIVIDLLHKKKNKQVRQVITQKNNTALIMTCTDDISSFNNTLSNCNEIIKSLKWKN